MRDFATMDAAQKWLDAQDGGRAPYVERDAYVAKYGAVAARCAFDTMLASVYAREQFEHGWTAFKMAARRQSNALASLWPATFEPKKAKAA